MLESHLPCPLETSRMVPTAVGALISAKVSGRASDVDDDGRDQQDRRYCTDDGVACWHQAKVPVVNCGATVRDLRSAQAAIASIFPRECYTGARDVIL